MKTMIRAIGIVIVLQVLGGCANSVASLLVDDADQPRFDALLADPTAIRAFLADTTIKDHGDPHGTQIEYHGADGRAFLVYPGNLRTVLGFWEVRGPAGSPRLCYRYPGSVDGVTGDPGDDWECRPAVLRLIDDEIYDGDLIGLRARGRALYPRPLPRDINVSIGEVLLELGLPPVRVPNKTFRRRN